MSGRNSGGDILDMAKDGTKVPADSAEPRHIPSKPRPDEGFDSNNPPELGGANLAEAANNPGDIPRNARDNVSSEVVTGTGDALPTQVDSKRLHQVPDTHDPKAKGSARYAKHISQESEFVTGASEGPGVQKAPGDETMSDEAAMNKYERKE